jgi:hypothetical protein
MPIAELWMQLKEYETGKWDEFKAAVTKFYPGASENRRWTTHDMDELVGRTRRLGISNTDDLGEYTRKFQTIYNFLKSKDRISDGEASRAYLSGFPDKVRQRLEERLTVMEPSHFDDEPWKLEQVQEVAELILAGKARTEYREEFISGYKDATPEPDMKIPKIEDMGPFMSSIIESLMKSVTPAITEAINAAQPKNRPEKTRREEWPNPTPLPYTTACFGCSKDDCTLASCPEIQKLIDEGRALRIRRGNRFRVVQPDGNEFPAGLRGRDLATRIKNFYGASRNPSQPIRETPPHMNKPTSNAPANNFMIEIAPDPFPFSPEIESIPTTTFLSSVVPSSYAEQEERDEDSEDETYDTFALMEELSQCRERASEIQGVLRQTPVEAYQGRATRSTEKAPPLPSLDGPPRRKKEVRLQDPKQTKPDAQNTRLPTDSRPIPLTVVDQRHFKPRSDIPVTDRANKEPQFRYRSGIEDEKLVKEVYERSLNSKIEISHRELLALAPEVRKLTKEAITSKRQTTGGPPIFPPAPNMAGPISNFMVQMDYNIQVQNFLDTIKPINRPEWVGAKSMGHLRTLFPLVAHKYFVESVLDPGCQIVAMSEKVWSQLEVPKDDSITVTMQSANGGMESTIGLVKNLPFNFEGLTIYLHVHVVRNAPYDILLGRPFDMLTRSKVQNISDDEQYITLHDPNSELSLTFATRPRGKPRYYLVHDGKEVKIVPDESMKPANTPWNQRREQGEDSERSFHLSSMKY